MKTIFSVLLILATVSLFAGEGYKIGDKAADFKLKNTDGKFVSLSDFPDTKGFVVVFTCNNCPYAKAYQDRIIALDKKYKIKGYPVIAINPNDPAIEPGDAYESMVIRAKDKGYTFPYLYDARQETGKLFGATRTPQVFLLKRNEKDELIVRYIGAIDDNYQDVSAVNLPYLENALEALLNNMEPNPNFTKAIGCSVKVKSLSQL